MYLNKKNQKQSKTHTPPQQMANVLVTPPVVVFCLWNESKVGVLII